MSYTLNPCKACWEKYKSGDCGMNDVNNCVVETAAAFSGIPSNNVIAGTAAGENWQDCMNKMLQAEGALPCSYRARELKMAPVFNQVPHYFPELLYKTGDAGKAQRSCMQKCSELPMNKKACMENCATDRAAVQDYEANGPYEAYEKSAPKTKLSNAPARSPDAKAHPVFFWIAFVITALLLVFVLAIFCQALTK